MAAGHSADCKALPSPVLALARGCRPPLSPEAEALESFPARSAPPVRSFSPAGSLAAFQADQPQAPLLLDLASNDYPGPQRPSADYGAAAHAANRCSRHRGGASRLISGSRPSTRPGRGGWRPGSVRSQVLLFQRLSGQSGGSDPPLADSPQPGAGRPADPPFALVGVRASGAMLRRFRPNDSAPLEALLHSSAVEDPRGGYFVAHRKACSAWRGESELGVIAGLLPELRALLLVDEGPRPLGCSDPVAGPGPFGTGGRSGLISGTFRQGLRKWRRFPGRRCVRSR